MKNLEAKNKCPAPTSAGDNSSRPCLGPPPPPPPRASGAQPPRPMWIVRHPQPPQGQAPRRPFPIGTTQVLPQRVRASIVVA